LVPWSQLSGFASRALAAVKAGLGTPVPTRRQLRTMVIMRSDSAYEDATACNDSRREVDLTDPPAARPSPKADSRQRCNGLSSHTGADRLACSGAPVLARVTEVGNHCRHPVSAGAAAGVEREEQLDQILVHRRARRLDHVDIRTAHRPERWTYLPIREMFKLDCHIATGRVPILAPPPRQGPGSRYLPRSPVTCQQPPLSGSHVLEHNVLDRWPSGWPTVQMWISCWVAARQEDAPQRCRTRG
jgi:hypothetical protein